ncbi:ATP-binding protein [Vibrio hannami]|uniref:PAS domain-containing sensor histidine kinase n=1 Tax=Vibrio hannami TaxID=2717094 RepID=UPI00240F0FDB|nr:ATP-binding protein [Vibrio hannami]MDG3085327.1 ATP-binding protein [Vibrio hannami]
MKKTLISFVVVLFAIALGAGYLMASSEKWLLYILLALSALIALLIVIKKIDDDIEDKYFWYEQLLDAVPTPLSVTDINMNWTFINKPVENLFDEPKRDFIGRQCNNWGAAICQTEKCGVWRLRKGETETFFSQFDREFRVDTSYLYSRKGEIVGHVEVCSDITAINAMVKAAQFEKESKNKLEEAYQELKQTQETLLESEKMASLGGLVAGVSHEINTPVGICVMASSVVEERIQQITALDDSASHERAELIEMIAESNKLISDNLTRTVELVKSFKQVAVDQSSLAKYRFKVEENLRHALNSLKHELKKKQVSLALSCSPEIEIHSYPGVFTQIYTNLVLNSIIHGFENKEEACNIDVHIECDGEYLIIHYSDNGKGVPPDILPKVFEPFVTTKRGQGGSGLGTSIIYNLVRHKLNGEIQCVSKQGKGCRFYIRIPLREDIVVVQVT